MALIQLPEDTSWIRYAIGAQKDIAMNKLSNDLQTARLYFDALRDKAKDHLDEVHFQVMGMVSTAINTSRAARDITLAGFRNEAQKEGNRHQETMVAMDVEKKRLDVVAQTGAVVDTNDYRSNVG